MKKLMATLSVLAGSVLLTGCGMLGGASAEGEAAQQPAWQSLLIYGGVIVVFFVAMYFMAIRPEKKREKEQKNMLASMAVGDTVLTTAGFYGVVIDITTDTVIVEFGNNKNCRIPMQKSAIVQLEHPEGYVEETKAEEKKGEEKK